MFNIGRQFIAMPFTEEEMHPESPSLLDYMTAFATLDYGHVSGIGARGRVLTEDSVRDVLERAGLQVVEAAERRYPDTVQRVRDWLSIPVFTERLFPRLSYDQRMASLDKAFARVDQAATSTARWMVFVATKP